MRKLQKMCLLTLEGFLVRYRKSYLICYFLKIIILTSNNNSLEMTTEYESEISEIESSDEEVETEVIEKPKKVKAVAKEVEKPLLSKTGRPKKVMSEQQKLNLAKARVKGREKRKELKGIRDQERQIKKDDLLIKKLEMEAKVLEHKRRLQKLAVNAGYANDEDVDKPIKKERKPKAAHDHLKDDNLDVQQKSQIEKLEEELAALRVKVAPKKKKVVAPVVEQDLVSESEAESDEEVVVPIKTKRVKPPVVNVETDKARKVHKNPIKQAIDPEMQARLQSLFPNMQHM